MVGERQNEKNEEEEKSSSKTSIVDENSKLKACLLVLTLGMFSIYLGSATIFFDRLTSDENSVKPQWCSWSQLNLYVDRFRFDLNVYVSGDELAPHPSELIWAEQNLTYSLKSPALQFNSSITIPEVS